MSAARGWCPTAWRPMAAADGLLLRVRPPLARVSQAQALLLADVATRYGSGDIDLTRRAAFQLRGFDEPGWRAALERLIAAGLVDPDPGREALSVLLTPTWQHGDDTHRIAHALIGRRHTLPALPAKFGIALDAGPRAVLGTAPADLRVERATGGGLILRPDGRAAGAALRHGHEVEALIALAHWFVASGGMTAGRMAQHNATLPDWMKGNSRPWTETADQQGFAPPFGRLHAEMLARWAAGSPALRLTPWRTLLVERDHLDPAVGPLRAASCEQAAALSAPARVDACVGAPECAQATVPTRELAGRLSGRVAGTLHVSGCTKGCARSAAAAVTIVGRAGRYDLVRDGRADAAPAIRGLTADQLLARLGAD